MELAQNLEIAFAIIVRYLCEIAVVIIGIFDGFPI
jgi:hypothetical protein